jgi:hypothetical protein
VTPRAGSAVDTSRAIGPVSVMNLDSSAPVAADRRSIRRH